MRVRLVVVEVVLVVDVVGREVPVIVPLILEVLTGCPVPRVLWVLFGPAVLGFFALVFTAVALVRKRVRMVWSVLVLLSAACCSCFRAAPPRRLEPFNTQLSASRSWP